MKVLNFNCYVLGRIINKREGEIQTRVVKTPKGAIGIGEEA